MLKDNLAIFCFPLSGCPPEAARAPLAGRIILETKQGTNQKLKKEKKMYAAELR